MDNRAEKLQKLERNASLKSLFPTHFEIAPADNAIYCWAQEDLAKYQELKNKINSQRTDIDARVGAIAVKSLDREKVYLIRDVNEEYYRVKIMTTLVPDDNSEPWILVQFMDLGHREACSLKKLTTCDSTLTSVPPLASRYRLGNVVAHGMGCFPAILTCLSKYLFVPCLGSVSSGKIGQILDLYDPLTAKTLADNLVEKKLALVHHSPAPSFVSQLPPAQEPAAPKSMVNGISNGINALSINDTKPAASPKPVSQPINGVAKPNHIPSEKPRNVPVPEPFARSAPQPAPAVQLNDSSTEKKVAVEAPIRVTFPGPKAAPQEVKKVEVVKPASPKPPTPVAAPIQTVTSPVGPIRTPNITSPVPKDVVDTPKRGGGGDLPIKAVTPQQNGVSNGPSKAATNIVKFEVLPKNPIETIFIILCNSSKDFYGQFIRLSDEELTEMGNDIQEYANTAPVASPSDFVQGQAVIAPFDDDGLYYRAVIEHIENGKATVFYVDWGNESVVELKRLMLLPSKFTRPPYGIRCSWKKELTPEQEGRLADIMNSGETTIQVKIEKEPLNVYDHAIVDIPNGATNGPIYDQLKL